MRRILPAGLLLLVGLGGGLSPVMAAGSKSFLAPSVVLGAFESNLAISSERTLSSVDRAHAGERLSTGNQAWPRPVEIAAVLEENLPSIFRANLANPIQQALTPTLSVTPDALSLSATLGASPTRHRLQIASLGETVNWSATARLLNGSGWLSVSPQEGSATTTQFSPLGVEVNYGALSAAGIYQALIIVRDTATGYAEVIPVAVVLSSQQARIGLSDHSILLTVAGGGAAPPPQTVQILNRGPGNLDWSFPASALQSWLNASSLSGRAGSDPAQASLVTFSLNNTAAQALPSGVYQTLIPISAPGASNDPQLITVTLQRVPGATPASPGIRPHGFLFLATQGGTAPAARDLTVVNRGGGTLTAQLNASTASGGNWLTVNPTGGTTASGPFTVQVSVNPGALPAGIYRGTIRGTFSSSDPLEGEVLLIVRPPAPAPQRLRVPPPPAVAGCTPTTMELIANTIGNGVSVPTSFPKVLVVSLVDSCGELVDDATVVGSAQGTSISLQSIGSGTYSGTWVPLTAGTVSLSFTALHSTLPTVSRSFNVTTATAVEGIQLPTLFSNGVVENAGFTPRQPLAPGSIVALFGTSFATQVLEASQIPLERELAGVKVRIGNAEAPLYRVASDQITAEIPSDLQPGATVPIVVNSNGRLTTPQNYFVSPAQPGIIVSGGSAVAFARGSLVTQQNPARIGDVLEIYALGLGKTDPPVSTGTAGFAGTLLNPVTVTIGGVEARVEFQGLNSCCVGLYQVNAVIPQGAPTGDAVPIVFRQNGVESNTILPATISIR